jgi:pimeloyl-ACP methyl ester carboxylesterase
MKRTFRLCITTVVAAVALLGATNPAPLVLERDASFFVGGNYVKTARGTVMDGQMYVHAIVPAHATHRYPIVMIHGQGLTGVNFETTADGREGWAFRFVRAGYAVYVVDQPARGRSSYDPELDGALGANPTAEGNVLFTAPEIAGKFPQAHLHTQMPAANGKPGQPGDRIDDELFASMVQSIPTATGVQERLTKAAGAALLDRIGPAILLTHSQAGAFGWQIADARPGMVKAIIAVEPALSPTDPASGSQAPAYGITLTPITYAPPAPDPASIAHAPQSAPDDPDVSRCWLQAPPVRRLPNLSGVPIAVVIGEASPLTPTAQCVSDYLTQAGVPNDLVRLERVGIHGNSHMMMIESNSDQIAAYLGTWLGRHGL